MPNQIGDGTCRLVAERVRFRPRSVGTSCPDLLQVSSQPSWVPSVKRFVVSTRWLARDPVVGVPSQTLGHRVGSLVKQCDPTQRPSAQNLNSVCSAQLSSFAPGRTAIAAFEPGPYSILRLAAPRVEPDFLRA